MKRRPHQCSQCPRKVGSKDYQTTGQYAGWCAKCIANAYENEQPWMRIALGHVYLNILASGKKPEFIRKEDTLIG